MRITTSCLSSLFLLLLAAQAFGANVTIDPAQGQSRISPYIYGANQVNGSTVKFTAQRQGGNRLTGYNWENNYSNAGSDWNMSSDTYMCDTASACAAPGAAITQYVDAARTAGAYALVTLQMAGYVSADSSGTVTEAQVAPSSRWKKVVPAKGSALALTPDLTDGNVYMDELVNFLVQRYGTSDKGGILGYSLDNEPDLWNSTHVRIHPEPCGAAELVQRSAELAAAVKGVDPSAEIFGFVSYGYAGYVGLQDAKDWKSVQGSYEWYVEYFLAQMAAASTKAGKRLLDVIDLHYYSEATGGGTRIQSGTTDNAAARVQSTRSLWDPNYDYSTTDPTAGENSWITQWNDAIQLIPRVRRYIDALYPGTKFAITEYDFGAADHISGGIAEADALGIYGREGLYFASRWGDPGKYTDAAYRLYLDYDGKGSRYGNINVLANTNDVVNVPVYAAIDESNPSVLHVILINRNLTAKQTATVTISGSTAYASGQAFGFDSSSSQLSNRGAVTVAGNSFSLELAALSATHVVLTAGAPVPITGVGGAGAVTAQGGSSATVPSGNGGAIAVPAGGRQSSNPGDAPIAARGGTANAGLGGAASPGQAGATSPGNPLGVISGNANLGLAGSANAATVPPGGPAAIVAGAPTVAATTNGKKDEGGCGCRVRGGSGIPNAALTLLAALVLGTRRRRIR